jgi:L-alanine-DL-glutamate epimerase-like enolase superfamily enzyme
MVEQPFPINFQVQDWIEVLRLYNQHDLLIFADDSVRTYEDIPNLKDVVNGVNIKLENCGGYRGALALTQ